MDPISFDGDLIVFQPKPGASDVLKFAQNRGEWLAKRLKPMLGTTVRISFQPNAGMSGGVNVASGGGRPDKSMMSSIDAARQLPLVAKVLESMPDVIVSGVRKGDPPKFPNLLDPVQPDADPD